MPVKATERERERALILKSTVLNGFRPGVESVVIKRQMREEDIENRFPRVTPHHWSAL